MSKTGRFYIRHENRLFCVEPISKYADRNADWDNGIKATDLPDGGAIHPTDSIITDKNFQEYSHAKTRRITIEFCQKFSG